MKHNGVTLFLFILAVALSMGYISGCILLTGYDEPKDTLCLTINTLRLPQFDSRMRLSVEPTQEVLAGWIKTEVINAADIRGVPLTVYDVKCDSDNIWYAIVGVDGVGGFETLNCIAKTLIQIPFVTLVKGNGIKVSR